MSRPKSKKTTEMEALISMLQNIPEQMKMTPAERLEVNASIEQGKRIEELLLREYRTHPTMSNADAYELASVESSNDESSHLQSKYAKNATKWRKMGAKQTAEKSETRARNIVKNNRILIDKIKTTKAYSINKVTKIIHEQWEAVSDAQRLKGEPLSLRRRGDGDPPKPSPRTLRRWIEKFLGNL